MDNPCRNLSGPEEDDPLRAFTIRATSSSETDFKTIDRVFNSQH